MWLIEIINAIEGKADDVTAKVNIKNFSEVKSAVKKCAMSFAGRKGGNNGKSCRMYCEYFNVNSTSAVIEGY